MLFKIRKYNCLALFLCTPFLASYLMPQSFAPTTFQAFLDMNVDSNPIEATRSRTNGAAKAWAVSSHGALIWSNFVFDKLLVY